MKNSIILLIPHYNDPKGLYKSLASIEGSESLDVIIVDDGSIKKPNEEKCNDAYKANGEIYFIYLEENQGIEIAMNTGIDYAKNSYKYIARLDCADIIKGNRFQKQYDFLEAHPDILIVGSHSNYVDMKGEVSFTQRNPLLPKEIQKKLYFNSTFVHPTIMFSTKILDYIDGYPTTYPSAEDYALYMDLNSKGVKMANLDEILLDTENNPDGISLSRRKDQLKSRLRLIWKYFYFGYYPIMGLIRNSLIYITPYSLLLQVKRLVKR